MRLKHSQLNQIKSNQVGTFQRLFSQKFLFYVTIHGGQQEPFILRNRVGLLSKVGAPTLDFCMFLHTKTVDFVLHH